MKKILWILIIIVLIFVASMTSFATADVKHNFNKYKTIIFTLKEAIDYAINNSEDLRILKLELERAEKQHKQHSRYLRRYSDEEKDEDLLEYYNGLKLSPTHQSSNVNKSLKDNGAKKKKVDIVLDIAEWNLQLMENKIRYNVEKGYYDLLQIEEDMNIAKESLTLAKNQYDQGKEMNALGFISEQQLLAAELGQYQAQTNYDMSSMRYDIQKMNFNNIIGLPLLQKSEISNKEKFKLYKYTNVDLDVKKANENNAIIKFALANKEIIELTSKALENTTYKWEMTYTKKELEYKLELIDKEIELKMAENNLQSIKNAVELSIRTAGMVLLNTGKQIDIYNVAANKAQKNYEIVQLKFQIGETTPNEVNQARMELMSAKTSLSKQMHEHNLAYLDYKYGIGLGKDIIR